MDAPDLTTDQTDNVFQVRANGRLGTALLCRDSAGTLFLTARHVLDGCRLGDNLYFKNQVGQQKAIITSIELPHNDSDVCVFACEVEGAYPDGVPLEEGQGCPLSFGQRLLFLGYPHGMENTFPTHKDTVSPLVRNAFFSGVVRANSSSIMVLDGFNNPGYSGGPIFGRQENGSVALAGIISGYKNELPERSGVYYMEYGKEKRLENLFVKPNSGMILATPLHYVYDILKRLKLRNIYTAL